MATVRPASYFPQHKGSFFFCKRSASDSSAESIYNFASHLQPPRAHGVPEEAPVHWDQEGQADDGRGRHRGQGHQGGRAVGAERVDVVVVEHAQISGERITLRERIL